MFKQAHSLSHWQTLSTSKMLKKDRSRHVMLKMTRLILMISWTKQLTIMKQSKELIHEVDRLLCKIRRLNHTTLTKNHTVSLNFNITIFLVEPTATEKAAKTLLNEINQVQKSDNY